VAKEHENKIKYETAKPRPAAACAALCLMLKNKKMKRNAILTGLMILFGYSIFSQTTLPIIKANSDAVSVQDGKDFKSNYWTITPRLRPDIYKTSFKHSKVTFYTDVDSITFKIKPGKVYNFIILMNGKDSAFTQIKYEHAKNVQGNLAILKKGGRYNLKDDRPVLKVTYESEKNPELVKVRELFKLDSIAGAGDEISKILNLLHWVHNSYVFDGTKELPPYVGIVELMAKCYNSNYTMYCGAFASVLNDCYLAMGLKSRQVVCLPKDSTDFDCHSINAVYSKTLNKWLWMDATNNAYVMNEKGELLSIAEVRERLLKNKPLILNPDANINRIYSVVKINYLYDYMAKNLYALECFAEGGGECKGNLLLPVEYKGIIPRTKMNNPKCTNNPTAFWAKPD